MFLKRGFRFNKKAIVFGKRALGLSRRVGGGRIPRKPRKSFFLKKRALFNKPSDPWALYFSKIGPGVTFNIVVG